MRILPSEEHHARKEKILQAVIHLFIKTGKPVGSSTILEAFRLNLSPASIRNVLADLEKEGFLTHPHTSAGRVPTDRGYRFYVDSIVHIQKLAAEEEMRIRSEYSRRMKEVEDLMMSTTRILSALSHCTGFVLSPKLDEEKLRRIELVPIDSTHIMGVLVSQNGMVRNHMMMVSEPPSDEDLRAASRFLTEKLAGLNFHDAQSRLLSELNKFHDHVSQRQDFFQLLSRQLFDEGEKKGLYVEGTSNMLNFPELRDYECMRNFAQLVDEKEELGQVLTRKIGEGGLKIQIGKEAAPSLKDFSVVSTSYRAKGRPVGILGILGPKRMEYERMIAIVNSVASLVTGALEEFSGPPSYLIERRKDDDRNI
jgi:heat-inducible transcriptional repressor